MSNKTITKRRGFFSMALAAVLLLLASGAVSAQTTSFTYQGKLTDSGSGANGNYDLQFTLFDSAAGGAQIGAPQNIPGVAVASGIFTVQLDFGAGAFPGASRFLEIGVRPAGGGAFTILSPRQPVTSTPHAIRALSAGTADTATNATQLNGVAAANYVQTADARLTDARAPVAGSTDYIQNGTTLQGASFAVGGNGTIGSVLTASTGRITGQLSVGGGAFPQHRLSIAGGSPWTSNGWIGAVDMDNASAMAWGHNASGQSFGIGQASEGLLIFHSASKPGNPTFPAIYDMSISNVGNVGIGTINPAYKLDVAGTLGSLCNSIGFCVSGANSNPAGGGAIFATGLGANGRGGAIGHPSVAAMFVNGSTWITGDSSPLPPSFGKGIIMGFGAGGTAGYISAFDYSTFTPQNLLLNNSGGNVGIRTNTPDAALTVNGTADKPGGGSWAVFSDERLKNIKGSFTPGLKAVMQLQPLRYEYKRDNALGIQSEGEHVGFGAQAVQKIIPAAVTKNDRGYLLINNDPIMWTMLNAIKEQQKAIAQLSAQVRQLQQANSRRHRGRR